MALLFQRSSPLFVVQQGHRAFVFICFDAVSARLEGRRSKEGSGSPIWCLLAGGKGCWKLSLAFRGSGKQLPCEMLRCCMACCT